MSKFHNEILLYFEERFPFFGFTLPVILILYPLLPSLVPLYLLPKYYGLHFLYLFLTIFNLRLQRDISEARIKSGFEKQFKIFAVVSAVVYLTFSLLFSYLEKGHSIIDLQFNWRSYFFFLACSSLLFLNWLWYFVGRKIWEERVSCQLIPLIKYPLIIIPPVFLNLHHSQTTTLSLFLLVILFHALCFEAIKEPRIGSLGRKMLLGLYSLALFFATYSGTGLIVLAVLLFFLGMVLIIFEKRLNQKMIFGPTLLFSWSIFFSTNF